MKAAQPPRSPRRPLYRLTHKLGAGGMGLVYAADKLGFPEPVQVAVKILSPELIVLGQREPVDMFFEEAVLSWRVNHEQMHLVTVYDFGSTDDGIPYLIMEKVDGVRLDYLERDPDPELRAVRRIAYDLLVALEHLHTHGLIHRDVTPRNILIADNGIVKLTDLGLVKEQQSSTSRCFRGTPAYASPEALQGRRCTPASDLYSLGSVLYELITGRKPFGTGSADEVAREMSKDECVALPDEVPEDLAALVRALTKLDPADRIQTAAEAIEQLTGPVVTDPELAALVARSPHPEPDPNVPELAWPFRERAPKPEPKPSSPPALGWPFRERAPKPEPKPSSPPALGWPPRERAPDPAAAAAPRRRWPTALALTALFCLGMLGLGGLGYGVGRMFSTSTSSTPSVRYPAPIATQEQERSLVTNAEESTTTGQAETSTTPSNRSRTSKDRPRTNEPHFEYLSTTPSNRGRPSKDRRRTNEPHFEYLSIQP